MNNLIRKFRKAIPTVISHTPNYNYNCNYDLIDSKGKIVVSARRDSCFKNIFLGSYSSSKKLKFDKGMKLRIYALQSEINNSDKEVRSYIRMIRALGVKFKHKIHKEYDLNASTDFAFSAKKLYCFKNQNVHTFEIKLDNISFTELKFLVYHIRYIYEFENHKVISKSLEYKKKFKKYNIFFIMMLFQQEVSGVIKLGHSIINGRVPEKYSLDDLKQSLKKYNSLDKALIEGIGLYTYYETSEWDRNSYENISKIKKFTKEYTVDKFYEKIYSDENMKLKE